jgi:hypothetical protein
VNEAGEVVKVAKAKPTPYETLRKVLDDARYHPVRELLSASSEGALAAYVFEAPADVVAGTEAEAEVGEALEVGVMPVSA